MRQTVIFLSILFFTACGDTGGREEEVEPTLYIYEDAESASSSQWTIRSGELGDVVNLMDSEIQSRVIEFASGGSYMIGDTSGEKVWGDTKSKSISFRLNSKLKETIYVLVDTKEGARKLFYRTDTSNRALKHGFIGGIHHGLGTSISNESWRTITRDLESDLKDAEPNNDLLAVNGLIHSGGEGNRMDDIILYNPNKNHYLAQEKQVENNFNLIINNTQDHILQWRFKDFGSEPRILSADPDERGSILDPDAFEFRVHVSTTKGDRDLIYTLGLEDGGLIENGQSIHHALGDDRTIGSVWAGDDPMNELGLWQTVTRDLQEDIHDFESNNTLLLVDYFLVKNRGTIDDVQMFSAAKRY